MKKELKFIDLFSGIGGFRIAFENATKALGLDSRCVLSSDIDKECRKAYKANFDETPFGDISQIMANDVPDHDCLLAGFPCQPFSIIGQRKGFNDIRGTLFFDIARILEAKTPSFFVLENVKQLLNHDQGRTLKTILRTLGDIGYTSIEYKILNAMDFGLPQKRERLFIVGFRNFNPFFRWPKERREMTPLDVLLEENPDAMYYASKYIQEKRKKNRNKSEETRIWHENKSGNISILPYSCALRAGASYNYLLVNGERRLTSREMLRLQGFPNSFRIVCSYAQTRKQAGNSLPVPVAQEVIFESIKSLIELSTCFQANKETMEAVK